MTENKPVHENEPYIRGYCNEISEWVTGNLAHVEEPVPGKAHIICIDENGAICSYRVIAETITASTGAKDRNGLTVFSGDILSIDYIEEIMYVFSTDGTESVLVPTSYVSRGQRFDEAEKHTYRLRDIENHIEIIGTVMQPLLDQVIARTDDNGNEFEPDDDEDWSDLDAEDYMTVDIDTEDISNEDLISIVCINSAAGEFIPDYTEDGTDAPARGLSTDGLTWLYGKPYLKSTGEDMEFVANMVVNRDGVISMEPFLIETLGKNTGITDERGQYVYTGDFISIRDKEVFLIGYAQESDTFKIIPYNMAGTKLELEPALWMEFYPKKVNELNLHPEIIGNMHTGIPDDIFSRLAEYHNVFALTEREIINITELNRPMYGFCRRIDAMIQAAVPGCRTEYYIQSATAANFNTIQLRSFRKDGYEVRGFYSIGTGEGSLYLGDFKPNRKFAHRHGLISTASRIDEFIKYYTMALHPDMVSPDILKGAVKPYSNVNVNIFPTLAKKLDYDNISNKIFKTPISQKLWFDTVDRIYGKKIVKRIRNRVLDTVGIPLFGESQCDADANYRIKTIYDIPGLQLSDKPTTIPYLSETGADCTFLLDRDGDFIYSCDIIDYDGVGRIVVFITTENDPNALGPYCDTHLGENRIFWTYLSELKEFYMHNDRKNLRWRYVSISEWITNRFRIKISGNLVDCHIEEKDSMDFTSDDFNHEQDPLRIVFANEDIIHIPESVDKAFHTFKDCYELMYEKMVSEEIFEKIYGRPYNPEELTTDEIAFTVVCTSRSEPLIHASVYDDKHDVEYRMIFDPEQSFITILKVDLRKYMTAGICEYLASFNDGIRKLRDIIINDSTRYDDVYYAVTNMKCDPNDIEFFQTLKDNVVNKGISYTQKEYMTAVYEHIRDIQQDCRWRAVSDKGMWFTGNIDSDNMSFMNILNGTDKIEYINESAGFNTFLLDSCQQYIYENDIIRFDGLDRSVIVIKSRSHIMNFGEVDVKPAVKPEDDQLMRCAYSAYSDGCGLGDMTSVEWVPCDIDWFIRNRDRLTVIGNVFDLSAEIYDDSDIP